MAKSEIKGMYQGKFIGQALGFDRQMQDSGVSLYEKVKKEKRTNNFFLAKSKEASS